MLRIYSQSLGCPKNRVDTERLLGSLGKPSLGEPVLTVSEPEEADLVFINTCAFIGPAVEESVRTIVQMDADLEDLPERPFFVVGGCLPGRYGVAELAGEIPEVDLWLHAAGGDACAAMLAEARKLKNAEPGRLLSTGPSYAWLKIGEGCRHRCSFCTIPSIRGPHVSAPAEALETEARALLEQGVKELVLVAQDVTAWGSERTGGRGDLRPLLERLLPLPGLERLRLMYLYPAGLTDDLLYFGQAVCALFRHAASACRSGYSRTHGAPVRARSPTCGGSHPPPFPGSGPAHHADHGISRRNGRPFRQTG